MRFAKIPKQQSCGQAAVRRIHVFRLQLHPPAFALGGAGLFSGRGRARVLRLPRPSFQLRLAGMPKRDDADLDAEHRDPQEQSERHGRGDGERGL